MWAGISFGVFAIASLLFAGFVQEPLAYLKEEKEGLYRELGGATAPLWSWSWGQLALFVAFGTYKKHSLSSRVVKGFDLCRVVAFVQLGAVGAFFLAIVI